jgi:hypothetical protein
MHIAFRGQPVAPGTLVATCLGATARGPGRLGAAMSRLFAIGALVGLVGCAHFRSAPVTDGPDTVGTLVPSETHVAQAPVHATTDFGHAEMVETGDHGLGGPSPAETAVAPVARGLDAGQPPAEKVVAPVATGVDDSPPPAETQTPDVVAKSAHGF